MELGQWLSVYLSWAKGPDFHPPVLTSSSREDEEQNCLGSWELGAQTHKGQSLADFLQGPVSLGPTHQMPSSLMLKPYVHLSWSIPPRPSSLRLSPHKV